MRRHHAVAVLLAALLIGNTRIAAQSAILTLPDVSQRARVMQRIGLTDITIDYHRPLVSGRKIFCGLEPYGEVWRAGANYNTTIEFTDPVSIEGQPLPKGIYGLHMIPGATSWVVIFSKNSTSWGSFTYDTAEDALRVTVKPLAIENHEALTYEFGVPTPRSVVISMRWEKVAVPFTVAVNTPELVAQSLRRQLRSRALSEWQAWEEVANYFVENTLDAEEALKYANRSIQIEDRFENEITKARVLGALGRTDEALAVRNKALGMGTERQVYDFGRGLQRLGQQSAAIDVFSHFIKANSTTWIAHNVAARIAVANGNFAGAVNEMKAAIAAAPDGTKDSLADLLRQLEANVDINR